MSKKHTPGPWVAGIDSDWSVDTGGDATWLNVGREGGSPIAMVVTDDWSDKADVIVDANARLIAAAPDLLAVAEWVIDNYATHMSHEAFRVEAYAMALVAVTKAKAAS